MPIDQYDVTLLTGSRKPQVVMTGTVHRFFWHKGSKNTWLIDKFNLNFKKEKLDCLC